MGSPARATIVFDGWNALILGTMDGTQVAVPNTRRVRIPFNKHGGCWSDWLVHGSYQCQVKAIRGIPCLEITGCNFNSITPDWMKNWVNQQKADS